MSKKKSSNLRVKALKTFKKNGGILKTSEAIKAGIHPRILYELLKDNKLKKLQRGLYAMTSMPDIEEPDLFTVAKKVPKGIICLISALYFHRLTVQIPRWIDIAVPMDYKPPRVAYPPVQFHWFSDKIFNSSIETHKINDLDIKIYSKEKTIIDCFRLRKKVGKDVAIESLKRYLRFPDSNLDKLYELAKTSRVLPIVQPYIEALTNEQS